MSQEKYVQELKDLIERAFADEVRIMPVLRSNPTGIFADFAVQAFSAEEKLARAQEKEKQEDKKPSKK